jgi:hypothetical protein
MDRVYLVHDVHKHPDRAADVRPIGVYESQERAQTAVERTRRLPSFSDAPAACQSIAIASAKTTGPKAS